VTDDVIAVIAVAACALLVVASFAFYRRQRLRFTRGGDPVLTCAVRWWSGPLGLGWRQGFVKLGKDELSWRRRLTFRATPGVVLAHTAIRLLGRSRPDWKTWMWISGADIVTFQTPGRKLELGLSPDDADLLLHWLGTTAERPSARISRGVSAAIWILWLAAMMLFWGSKADNPWIVPGILVAAAVLALAGGLVVGLVRRRRLRSEALSDEFVAATTEVLAFLKDFGFDDAYVRHLPWETQLVFASSDGRIVVVTGDSRAHSLDLSIGRRPDRQLVRLRNLLLAARHPDPDRVTRYEGTEGSLREALDANAHALRLWGRSFLTGAGAPEASKS
jgi:Protein of unknown function (DUF2550)